MTVACTHAVHSYEYPTGLLYYTIQYIFFKNVRNSLFFFIYCTDPQRGAGCGAFVNHSHSRDPGPHSKAVYLCDATYSKPTSQYRYYSKPALQYRYLCDAILTLPYSTTTSKPT